MLTGVFTYKDHQYGVRGYDFGTTMDFRLTPVLREDKLFLDEGFIYSDGNRDLPRWNDLWVGVGLGYVKTDCYIEEYGNEKIKNAVNKDLLTTFGQILAGMKAGCNGTNLVKEDDELFSTNFNPRDSFTYEYEHGKLTTRMQIIETLSYSNGDVSLSLEDDMSFAEQIYPDKKNPHKFKLDLSEFVVRTMEEDDSWDFGSTKIYTLQEIIERNPNKSYVWLKDRKYYIIKEIDQLEKVCTYLWQFKLLAFDTETTGLKINVTSRRGQGDRLVGMIFSAEPGIAYYIPIAHKKFKNICTPGEEQGFMEKYIKPLLEKKDILCHNGAYDWKVMHIYNICMNLKHDTYILFKVTLGNDHPQLGLGLKALTHTFLNRDSFELSDFVEGKFDSQNVKFWDFDEESTKYYACPDCDNLIELYQYAINAGLLEEYEAHKVYELETQFSIVIAYQEFYGHHVDMSKREQLVEDLIRSKTESYAKMVEIVGHDFNPKSNKDLPKVMYEELKMPILGYTDAGNPGTGKDVRKLLLQETNPDGSLKYPFVKYLSEYLDARTLESNFTSQISKFATEDGLMFSEVEQFLATGRVSVKGPNYQGYSDVVKKYINPRMDYYAIDADYSTIEARIMCSMAGCRAMVEKLKNPDTDYHRQKASDMFKVPYELVTKALRQMSKGVNFGILYGLGDPNLGVNLFGFKSPENTRKAAKQKELYYVGMEELKPFTEYSRNQGVTLGYSTTYFKRRRYFNKAKVRRDTIERQSCNARIQGTAADLYKLGMVRLFTEIRNRGWLGLFLISGFVHDECYNEVHKSINPFLALKVVRDAMMIEIDGWTTLFTGEGVGRTWYEAKKTEIPVQVQVSLTEQYADNCPSWWDGNTAMLCDFVVDSIMDYKRDRIISYLKNPDNWGKVLQPTENELAHELLGDIAHGQKVKGLVTSDVSPKSDVLENLQEFCKAFGCEDLYEKADVRKPELVQEIVDEDEVESHMISQDDISPEDALRFRVESMGVVNVNNNDGRRIYFRLDEKNVTLMNLVRKTFENNPGEVEVRAFKNGEEYKTGLFVNPKVYSKVLQLYLTNRNLQRG